MSLQINLDRLSKDDIMNINKDLVIKLENKKGYGPVRYVSPYALINNIVYLPFNYGISYLRLKRRPRNEFPVNHSIFTAVLRDEQIEVKKEAIRQLNINGSVILSMYCGFGKTVTSINISCAIKLKTIIIVNKIVLMKQWKDSIDAFCDHNGIQLLKSGDTIDDECDFFIINAQNIEKFDIGTFRNIGTVIVDEAHLIMAEQISKCLTYIQPRYLIGLTATPYRPDGLDNLLSLYFGDFKIIRTLNMLHHVFPVQTGFKPPIEYGVTGQLNWNAILDSQAMDEDRNTMILNIIEYFSDKNILVLVKRVKQAEWLETHLQQRNVTVTSLIGSNQTFDRSSRVLLGTASKVGTGFDHPKLNMLILAADVEEYFIQYLGRCMRTKDSIPYVIDLIDDNNVLRKHYKTRKNIYEKHGGIIKTPYFIN